MNLTPERDEVINFWPGYSDLAMVMVLLLLLFILTQFVVNSKLLTNEALVLAKAEAEQEAARRQYTAALEEAAAKREEDRKWYAAILAAAESRYTASERERAALKEGLARKSQARERVENRQAEIKKRFIQERGIRSIVEDGSLQIFTFSADVLFPIDQADLSVRGNELLRSFGRALQQHAEFYTRIEVEGHADENASRNFFRADDVTVDHGNWRLSAERAITVAQLFQSLGITGEKLAVVGRSFYAPENSGRFTDREIQKQAWAQNRRIQVRLFYSEITP